MYMGKKKEKRLSAHVIVYRMYISLVLYLVQLLYVAERKEEREGEGW